MDATITPFPQADPLPQFKDRRAGLIVFGVLEMLAGAICVLLVPLMLLGQTMSVRATHTETSLRMILPAVFIYLIMAAVFIWLGIGSVLARRWARALSLILAWSWLAIGVLSMIFWAIMFPKIFGAAVTGGQPMPVATKAVVLVVMAVFMGFIFIVVPGAMVLFYGSKHVKATCEARDPIVRWTDVRPLPVIGLCVWLWFGAGIMLFAIPAYNCVIAFFGTLLSGWPGMLVYLLLVAIWVYAARALYQLKLVGWWVVVIAMALLMVSNLITFARVDMMEMYRLMGYPEAQIAQMKQFNVFQGGGMMFWSVAWVLPVFGYLVYVRRFLAGPASTPQSAGAV
jgi:hypothetical protein